MTENAVRAAATAAQALGLTVTDPTTTRVLQVMVCAPLVPRLPALGDGIRMFVGQWRDTPSAGGLA
jgi:hypothetical protein